LTKAPHLEQVIGFLWPESTSEKWAATFQDASGNGVGTVSAVFDCRMANDPANMSSTIPAPFTAHGAL
jgi:hypothetical protein